MSNNLKYIWNFVCFKFHHHNHVKDELVNSIDLECSYCGTKNKLTPKLNERYLKNYVKNPNNRIQELKEGSDFVFENGKLKYLVSMTPNQIQLHLDMLSSKEKNKKNFLNALK